MDSKIKVAEFISRLEFGGAEAKTAEKSCTERSRRDGL